MPKKIPPEIKQIRDRCVVDVDQFEAWLAGNGWSWKGIDSGHYGFTLEEAQFFYICQDPVLWAKAFLNDPDNNNEPWTFFDYQEESIRAWAQDCIHKDGAEVGKTREIVVLICWGASTGFGGTIQRPWMLVGAPQQTHLDEIIESVELHFGVADEFDGEMPLINEFWLKPKKHPHYCHRFRGAMGYSKVYYRPAGHDGESFRGVHVNAVALMDESAKIKNAKCWTEFHRALKPGCIQRIYSVPDGDRSTEYFKMSQQATVDLPPGSDGFRLFHWPKTLMPPPFWDDERRRKFIQQYGSSDAPGYVRNVLGEDGQAENPVWPYEILDQNIIDVPEYVCIKLIADRRLKEMNVQAYRVKLKIDKDHKTPINDYLYDDVRDLGDFEDGKTMRHAFYSLLREFLDDFPPGVYWGGIDFGYSKDPTEIKIRKEVGHVLRDVLRIQLRGVGYDQQCELFYALDSLLKFWPSWGVDFGSAGTAVVQILQSAEQFEDGHYDDRLTGFQFATAIDAIDEEGNYLEGENRKGDLEPIRLPAKELATVLISKRLQRRGYANAFDQDVISDFTNHTAKEGSRHLIYSKKDDHTIDADRVLMLRKVFNDELAGDPDIFSSGVHQRAM